MWLARDGASEGYEDTEMQVGRCLMVEVLRVANCSGFYGDRLDAAKEMIDGGPVDVLTGDYLE